MENSAWANSFTAFSSVSAGGAASVAVVAAVVEAVLVAVVAGVAAPLVVAVLLVVDVAVFVGAGVLLAAAVDVDVTGVAAPAAALLAGCPTPSAWKAAIMALTGVFSRKRGRSSSS
jgi:hypothetical protein